jgi:hypothetical protein
LLCYVTKIFDSSRDCPDVSAQLAVFRIDGSSPLLTSEVSREARTYSGYHSEHESGYFKPIFAFRLGSILITQGL